LTTSAHPQQSATTIDISSLEVTALHQSVDHFQPTMAKHLQNAVQVLFITLLVAFGLLNSGLTSIQARSRWYDSIASAHKVLSQRNESLMNVLARQQTICNKTQLARYGAEWVELCSEGFLQTADEILSLNDHEVYMVQIGAHTGFDANDPFADGISDYLNLLSHAEKQRFHWVFVEPSPANYVKLEENVAKYSHLCDMSAVNAGIVSDSLVNTSSMTFYSVRDTIDPMTGYDTLSGKRFPVWITQVSSFSRAPLTFNEVVWKRLGLEINDYIVETDVTTTRYSELMKQVLAKEKPLFLLIDTEGFDCDIILGIDANSSYLPKYLIFEHKNCKKQWESVELYLKSLGYTVKKVTGDNTFAHRVS
jgi:FkbM family methyltransferase